MAKNCLCYYGESIVWQATVYEGWSEPNFENLDHTLKPMLLPNSVHNPRVFGWLFFYFWLLSRAPNCGTFGGALQRSIGMFVVFRLAMRLVYMLLCSVCDIVDFQTTGVACECG